MVWVTVLKVSDMLASAPPAKASSASGSLTALCLSNCSTGKYGTTSRLIIALTIS